MCPNGLLFVDRPMGPGSESALIEKEKRMNDNRSLNKKEVLRGHLAMNERAIQRTNKTGCLSETKGRSD